MIFILVFTVTVLVYMAIEMIESVKEKYPNADIARLFACIILFLFSCVALILILTGYWWTPPF